jgi:phosphoribosylanthranilate isomerase
MARAVQPDIIHISSDTEAVGIEAMRELRRHLPEHVALMKAIHVGGWDSLQTALAFTGVSDILLLDTKVEGMPGVGATGVSHDWNISRDIVGQVGNRAKLSGGGWSRNVGVAIAAVRSGRRQQYRHQLPRPGSEGYGRVRVVREAKSEKRETQT